MPARTGGGLRGSCEIELLVRREQLLLRPQSCVFTHTEMESKGYNGV